MFGYMMLLYYICNENKKQTFILNLWEQIIMEE